MVFLNRLKGSPITLAVVVSITFLYMVLLGFCVRAEKNNKENHGAVYIDDNTVPAANSQRYLTHLFSLHMSLFNGAITRYLLSFVKAEFFFSSIEFQKCS